MLRPSNLSWKYSTELRHIDQTIASINERNSSKLNLYQIYTDLKKEWIHIFSPCKTGAPNFQRNHDRSKTLKTARELVNMPARIGRLKIYTSRFFAREKQALAA